MPDIRVMTVDDSGPVLELMASEMWAYSGQDLERLLSYSPGGCFLAVDDGGRLAGMVTTTPYGRDGAFIGCLMVTPDHRGTGLGGALLTRAMDHLRDSGTRRIFLEAVQNAVGMYEKYGFVGLWQSLRLLGLELPDDLIGGDDNGENDVDSPWTTEEPAVRVMTEADLEDVLDFDGKYTGMDRSVLLRDLLVRFPDGAFVCHRGDDLTGFLSVRPTQRGYRLGPWVCEPGMEDEPEALLRMVRHTFQSSKLFVGIPVVNTVGVSVLKRHGFRDGITCRRMRWGDDWDDGTPKAIYGIASMEKG